MRHMVMPGARSMKTVAMRLIAGQDRRRADGEDAHDPHVGPRAGTELAARQRRVERPAGRGRAVRRQERRVDREAAADEHPDRQRVHPRERHVGRADLQRDEVVREPQADGRDDQEDHRRPVDGEDLVVRLLGQERHVRAAPAGCGSAGRAARRPGRTRTSRPGRATRSACGWSSSASRAGPGGAAARRRGTAVVALTRRLRTASGRSEPLVERRGAERLDGERHRRVVQAAVQRALPGPAAGLRHREVERVHHAGDGLAAGRGSPRRRTRGSTSSARRTMRLVSPAGSTSVGGFPGVPTTVTSCCRYVNRHCHWNASTFTITAGCGSTRSTFCSAW